MAFLHDAIDSITKEIIGTARAVSAEQRAPGCSADDSDQRIEDGKLTIRKLRSIREQLEEILTGVLL
jgi:hypothetical protein